MVYVVVAVVYVGYAKKNMKKMRKINKMAETLSASSRLFDRLEKYLSSSCSPLLTVSNDSSTLSSILQARQEHTHTHTHTTHVRIRTHVDTDVKS